jgi:hypothetical protein
MKTFFELYSTTYLTVSDLIVESFKIILLIIICGCFILIRRLSESILADTLRGSFDTGLFRRRSSTNNIPKKNNSISKTIL